MITAAEAWRAAFESAAIAGVEPWQFTMRELQWMADARLEHEWNLSAAIQALLAEVNRDRKTRSKPFTVHDFHPLHARRRQQQNTIPMGELRTLFTEGKPSAAIRERM